MHNLQMNSTHQRCLIVFFNLIIECRTPKTLPLWALKKSFNFSFRFASWNELGDFRVLKDLQPLILIDHLMLGATKKDFFYGGETNLSSNWLRLRKIG